MNLGKSLNHSAITVNENTINSIQDYLKNKKVSVREHTTTCPVVDAVSDIDTNLKFIITAKPTRGN